MSKGNDINVGSIEEDIKQLKDLIRDRQSFITDEKEHDEIYLKDIKAINNLINNYTRQKQINEEHQKVNGELREKVKELEENAMFRKSNNIAKDVKIEDITQLINKSYKEFMNGFIPKQKVKNLMEKEKLPLTIVGGRNNSKTLAYGIRLGKIKAFEQLLQESEDK